MMKCVMKIASPFQTKCKVKLSKEKSRQFTEGLGRADESVADLTGF